MNGKFVLLEVLDTGGDPKYYNLQVNSCLTGSAFIIVYSATSRDSFNSVEQFAAEIRRHHPTGCPLALVATQSDLLIKVSVEEG